MLLVIRTSRSMNLNIGLLRTLTSTPRVGSCSFLHVWIWIILNLPLKALILNLYSCSNELKWLSVKMNNCLSISIPRVITANLPCFPSSHVELIYLAVNPIISRSILSNNDDLKLLITVFTFKHDTTSYLLKYVLLIQCVCIDEWLPTFGTLDYVSINHWIG